MKVYKSWMLYIAPVLFAAHSLFIGQIVFGQEGKPSPQPTASPSQNKANPDNDYLPPPKAMPSPAPAFIPESPRERRALAYAKLLEAQRHFYALQRMNNPANEARPVITARAALMMAIQLEPKLSEAYTLLAELTANYPPRDWDESIKLCQLAIQANPDGIGAHQLLSRIYTIRSGLKQGTMHPLYTELAIKTLREVVRLNESSAEAWALLSEFYKRTGQHKAAIGALTRWAGAPTPLESEAGFYQSVTGKSLSTDMASASLGQALMREGNAKEGIAAISRAIYLNPNEESYIELLADAFDDAGGDDLAIIEVKRLVATNPSSTRLVRLLASVQSRTGKFDDAIATLKNNIARNPRDNEGLKLALAQTYVYALRESDAIAVYEDLLKSKNIGTNLVEDVDVGITVTEVFSQIIALQKNLGDFKGAEQTIERMRTTLGKESSSAEKEIIEMLRDQGRYAEALQQIRALRQKAPSNLSNLITEAQILSDMGHVDEGVALLRSKLSNQNGDDQSETPNADIRFHLIISSFFSQAKRGKEAVEASQQAISILAKNKLNFIPDVFYSLASAQEQAGDYKGAEDSLRKVLNVIPNDPTALNNLGYFLIERNERLEEAVEMIRRALRAEPTSSSYLDSLGWGYFKLGKLEEAERYLSEAARRSPFSATIQDHLGDVYNNLGKTESARTAWQRALKLTTPKDEQAKIKAKLNGKATGKKL